ncbi:DNA helicase RecQ [Sinimarinibacterium sp. NLF-5-8]|uniref:DNA helicase RecQ n=1 Tax=Sinimarinibacterium sp. NLF-5-8 TaxID=2698684 RepID=UPI00137BEB26|nr:DNA helicase RecQ [Sinimarinibacterium sp. NLF-5-8]QHS08790.1 DNA helicase RecQ [Sinimarinibacterium sp. NLF-5-8]
MSPSVLDALKRQFGFERFRPGQQGIVEAALEGRDLLAIMPTGGGKSLCFQLPAVLSPGVTVVVSPLIALMQDQVRLLDAMGIPATFLNSTLDGRQTAERCQALMRGQVKLLYVAPERLLLPEFLNGFLRDLDQQVGLTALVIDEAHCVSEWGHDFRPEYRQLAAVRARFEHLPCWAFTATATERVRSDIIEQLALHEAFTHVASFERSNLHYAVRSKDKHTYAELLNQARGGESGIIYCLSRKGVEELAERLQADGVNALPYHAGLAANIRREHQDRYIRDDAQIIVATNAFGMGINKPDVRWVIHYGLPSTIEGYYQEAGRAGRDGEPARCTLYYALGDIRTAEFLIQKKIHPETGEPLEEEQRVARQQLRQVIDYAESGECRRNIQLRYFGEQRSDPCGRCDNCCEPRPSADRTIAAQKLLSCIARLRQRNPGYGYGGLYVIDLLRGANTERIRKNGHTDLSTYGIGKDLTVEQWRIILRSLLHQGLLTETQDGFPTLALNPQSHEVMRGKLRVHVVEPIAQPKPSKRTAPSQLSGDDEALFEELRMLRKHLAETHSIAPYMVFSDASLRAMVRHKPQTLDDFARIPGVGERKLELYSDDFIGLIHDYVVSQ